MERNLKECLEGSFERKYLFPFFWQHGESHEELAEEMEAIYDSGVRQFCVESRTHEDFGGPTWWEDMGFILEYARQKGMGVWLLDDKRFPSGYANGYIESHPELEMVHLKAEFRDMTCGRGEAAMLVPPAGPGARLEEVVAYRLNETGDAITGEGILMTDRVHGDLLSVSLPRGIYRIYYIYRGNFAPRGKRLWVDMLNPESARAMLHAVYEPTYAHFASYFGNTFLGFFSDEPGFANEEGHYYSILGKEDMPVPYREDLCRRIGELAGLSERAVRALLPALWHRLEGDGGAALRTYYMQAVTELYRENFSMLLGNWCRERGVMYVGHVIEDNGTHMRLGYGAGHFFRALDGQDMAGIDVVLHQIVPGFTDARHSVPLTGRYAYPDMFNYLLAKLGSSHAHVDPVKRGRAMCEIYGAFGWAEGLPYMKRLTDHMLVNGINYYVPHAFTPRHNDPDCPPHFYNRGDNTQFALFGRLMEYMQRMCHLISDGVHRADVAVLYAPEGEWSGNEYQLPEKLTRALTRGQVDFDLIPGDRLRELTAGEGGFRLGGESYRALLVPMCDTLPRWILARLRELSDLGEVIFCDRLPRITAEGEDAAAYTQRCRLLPLEAVAGTLRAEGKASVTLSRELPLVRFYHVTRGGEQVYLFMNEDEWESADFTVQLEGEDLAVYDAMDNRLLRPQLTGGGVRLCLAPGQLAAVVSGVGQACPRLLYGSDMLCQPVTAQYTVSVRDYGCEDYEPVGCTDRLEDITALRPGFCGRIRYDFTLPETAGERLLLDLGLVGETAELWINGEAVGSAVSDPWCFEITGRLDREVNEVRVEVVNNQAYRLRDPFSGFIPLPVSGMVGPVVLKKS